MTRMMNQNQQQFAHESNSRLFIGNSEIKIIPSEFLISVDYQRKLEMERVMHIVDNFDINKVNIPKVSLRGNNSNFAHPKHAKSQLYQGFQHRK